MPRDVVCDRLIDEEEAAEAKLVRTHKGQTYYFCSRRCMEEFDRDPAGYGRKPGFYAGVREQPRSSTPAPGRI